MPKERIIKKPTIKDLANWFLVKEPMTHKKLQKLCYYAVAWGYALMNRRVFQNDEFQAWVHGPVSPALYQEYKAYGWNNIDMGNSKAIPKFDKDIEELLEAVWETYGKYDGTNLEILSHTEQPWQEARKGVDENQRGSNPISTKTMHDFYLSIYSGDDK